MLGALLVKKTRIEQEWEKNYIQQTDPTPVLLNVLEAGTDATGALDERGVLAHAHDAQVDRPDELKFHAQIEILEKSVQAARNQHEQDK